MSGQYNFRPTCIAALVFGAAMAVMEYYTPKCLDVLVFLTGLRDTNPDGYTVGGLIDYFNSLRVGDTPRLFNNLAPFFHLYVPQWLFALFLGFCCGLTLWLALKFAGLRRGEGLLGFYSLWLLVIFLPWNKNLLIQTYTLNYIVPAAFCLAGVWLLTRAGRAARTGGIILLLLAAVSHEGIGSVVACGVALMWLRFRDKRYRFFYVALLAAALVSVLWMSGSYLTERLGDRELPVSAMMSMTQYWLTYNCLTVGLIVLAAIMLCFRRTRLWLKDFVDANPYSLFFFGTALGGFMLAGIVAFSHRVAYWPQLCSAVVWGMILLPLLRRRPKASAIVGAVLGLGFVAFAAWSATLCKRINDAYTVAEAQIEASPTGTVFCKMPHECDFPPYVTRFATKDILYEYANYHFLSEFYGKKVAFVPDELRDKPTDVPPDSLMRSESGYFYYRPSQPYPWSRKPNFNGAMLHFKNVSWAGDTIADLSIYLTYTAPDGTQMVFVQPKWTAPSETRYLILNTKNPEGLEETLSKEW